MHQERQGPQERQDKRVPSAYQVEQGPPDPLVPLGLRGRTEWDFKDQPDSKDQLVHPVLLVAKDLPVRAEMQVRTERLDPLALRVPVGRKVRRETRATEVTPGFPERMAHLEIAVPQVRLEPEALLARKDQPALPELMVLPANLV